MSTEPTPSQGDALALTFDELRQRNVERQSVWRDQRGDTWQEWSIADRVTALCGELGEAANLLKKVRRGDFTLDDVRQNIADELADVQTYLDLLAWSCGIDLGAATVAKWNLVSERIGSPLRLAALRSDTAPSEPPGWRVCKKLRGYLCTAEMCDCDKGPWQPSEQERALRAPFVRLVLANVVHTVLSRAHLMPPGEADAQVEGLREAMDILAALDGAQPRQRTEARGTVEVVDLPNGEYEVRSAAQPKSDAPSDTERLT